MASRFWRGGSGTWNNATTTNWSTLTGGAGGASAPTAADDVFIDANSGGGTITVATTAVCRSLDCTNAPVTTVDFATTGILKVGDGSGGAMTLVPNLTISGQGGSAALQFVSTSTNGGTGWAVTNGGKSLPAITFNGAGGKWVMQDTMNIGVRTLSITAGAFFGSTGAGNTITCGTFAFSGSSTRTCDLTNCTINVTGSGGSINGGLAPSNLTFVTTGSTFVCSGAGTGVSAGFQTFNVVRMTGTGTAAMSNGGTFATLERSNAVAVTMTFTHGQTFTATTWILSGTLGNIVTINSDSAGSAATLVGSGGPLVFQYLSVKDSTATGSEGWYALNSTSVSGNTGWVFNAAIAKALAGALTPAGVPKKGVAAFRSGGLTPAGAPVKGVARLLGGGLTPSGVVGRAVAAFRGGSLTPSGVVLRSTAKTLGGAVVPAGTVARGVGKKVAGVLTPAGTVVRAVAKTLAGALAPSGSPSKSVARLLSGSLTPAGSPAKTAAKPLTGAMAPSGAIVKTVGKSVSGGLVPAGTFGGDLLRFFGGTISAAGHLLVEFIKSTLPRHSARRPEVASEAVRPFTSSHAHRPHTSSIAQRPVVISASERPVTSSAAIAREVV